MQYAPEEDPVHQRFILDTELDMAKAAEPLETGAQTLAQWQALADWLVQYNGIPKPVADVSKVFTSDYLP